MAANLVFEKLAPFFEKELQLLRGDEEEVAHVRRELERMKAFLSEADALEEGTDKEVIVWVKQIRDVVHDIEDILDEYMLLLTHNHGEGLYGFIHKMSCCIRNMKARYRVASKVQDINSRIRSICEGHRRLRQHFGTNEGSSYSSGSGNLWQDCRGDAMFLDQSDLVGIDEPKSKLVEWLVNGGLDLKVVSISGMGGLGKTTLAKQVYDDAEVKKHFIIHGWITFSQSFKLESLLKDLIQQLCRVISKPVPEDVDSMSTYQLKITIKMLLQRRRYLIVLDDLWHIHDWNAIIHTLPADKEGSRVMLTTRNAELAFSASIEPKCEGAVYNLEPLPLEESWTLLCRKTFRDNTCPPHLEDICKQILRKCEGLPLAIVAISGVLTTKDRRRIDEWEMVLRCLGAEIDGNDRLMNLKKVLSLSFNYLPYYLKPCLLYFSIFPEDHAIELRRLVRLWTAAGFVEEKQGKTQEEVAEDFFNQLVNRSLIQVSGTTSDVLDLQAMPLTKFPIEVANLYYLKYLSLRKTKIAAVPKFIGKLLNLETLDLKHTYVTELPVEILQLQRLRHLLVYRYEIESYDYFHSKYGFKDLERIGDLQSLQKLCFIEVDQGSIMLAELGKLTQLRRLGIIKLRKEDGKELCSAIENLKSLRALSITSIEEDEIVDVEHLISPPPLLQRLYLRGRLQTMPHWIPGLHSLVYDGDTLCFRAGGFKKLNCLCLDKLDELKLVQVEEGAMPCIQKLSIQRCKSMLKLPQGIEHLTKLNVLELFDMPQELIWTLGDVPHKFISQPCPGPDGHGEDYWRIAHVPEVYHTYWADGAWQVYTLEALRSGESSYWPNNIISSERLQTCWK
ncbi:Disease resistance protein [Corchorus capsularis]|uniref:Disease resistance protein n=1 Tax=Corchorus capsularis TaxID=210143 RepID=A0A1R3KXD8_COCAP|nr:Disease resistance protein [Corchorus capsularis]